MSGAERNAVERNGARFPLHCLGILRRSGNKHPFHCLESGRNGMFYNIFIPILPLFK